MKEDGTAGAAVTVTANGAYTVCRASAVSSMSVRVNDYAALVDLVRDQYYGRVVDVLEVKTA